MKTKTALIIFFLIVTAAMGLHADGPAVISYAEGLGFTIISDGNRTSWNINVDDVIGLPLVEGDTVLTDNDSFVEIQLTGGDGGVVKLAENTTFRLMSLDESGGGVFKVVYGRIRVKVSSLIGSSRLWVTGHDTVAGVRGTDFGYDLFYDPAEESSVRNTAVYVFDGDVDVVKYEKETVSKIDLMDTDPVVLSAGKMVLTSSDEPDQKLKVINMDQSIYDYWAALPIMTTASESPMLAVEETPDISENLNLAESSSELHRDMEVGGKIVFATGVGLMTIGGLLRVFAPDQKDISTGLLAVGAGTTLGGGGMLLYSIKLR